VLFYHCSTHLARNRFTTLPCFSQNKCLIDGRLKEIISLECFQHLICQTYPIPTWLQHSAWEKDALTPPTAAAKQPKPKNQTAPKPKHGMGTHSNHPSSQREKDEGVRSADKNKTCQFHTPLTATKYGAFLTFLTIEMINRISLISGFIPEAFYKHPLWMRV
jgi:hypothetical protein